MAQRRPAPTVPMHVVYSPDYDIDIGLHVFPTSKFAAIHRRLKSAVAAGALQFDLPHPADWDDLATVHAASYLQKLRAGRLSMADVAQLELPWSARIVEGFRLMTGGTIDGARLAAEHGIAVHLGGGFHHAFADHGEGFCMFNDVAVAVRVLQRERRAGRFAIVDCDVHHGNGTASIFAGDPAVFTMSMHQLNNYPATKPPSTLDVHLRDGAGDDEYLRHLVGALPAVLEFRPDLAFYLAGADPYEDDQLGGLALTQAGLRARDRAVFEVLRDASISVIVVLAGGYARRLEDTVAIHVATVEEALGPGGGAGSAVLPTAGPSS